MREPAFVGLEHVLEETREALGLETTRATRGRGGLLERFFYFFFFCFVFFFWYVFMWCFVVVCVLNFGVCVGEFWIFFILGMVRFN